MAKGERRKFLRQFLKNPASVGAIAPSSPQLAAAMVRGLETMHPGTIVEFGPGTGAFTAAIRDSLSEGSRYLGIEVDENFVRVLEQKFPGLEFETGSAADVAKILAERGLPQVRAVISGLPFASLPVPLQDGIVAGLREVLPRGAMFRTFQYVHAYRLKKAVRFRQRMQDLFGEVDRSKAVLRNLPPAYSLTWIRRAGKDQEGAHTQGGTV